MKTSTISPKEFLKARRPERFSDSIVEEVTEIDRGILENHLHTLTSRSQEKDFEEFARALIKREICPNILPQTGPTGGGDSRVDSETYPVSESLALAWYIGFSRESSAERWAFAFSAKQKWTSKLRSDIAKLVSTNRGYKKAFFVTNQYVRDKRRSELEDELSTLHNLDVRILDRTWILDVVFDNGRQEIAIQKLGVSPTIRKHKQQGPLDLRRAEELTRLERRIDDAISTEDVNLVTVDDCINAAVISRELECPKIETLGRFERAQTLASKYGSQHQRIRCAYDRAWTAFFWFEDIDDFVECYSAMEKCVKEGHNIYHLELLTNLWMLLHGHARDISDIKKSTNFLTKLLRGIAENQEIPTAALEAEAFLLKISLTQNALSNKPLATHLNKLREIIDNSEPLIGFPLLPLIETVITLGDYLGETRGYDDLHERMVDIVSRRKGEVEGAKLLLERAEQQLNANQPINAIRSTGKAFERLAKEESRTTFCEALFVCACAYERIGLLWAARGTLLMAAAISLSDYWKYEDVTLYQAAYFRRLKWIELQIGRIPQVLSWHVIDSSIRETLLAQGYDEERITEGNMEFDAILGILLLKTDIWELKDLVCLPDLLNRLGLSAASVALLYALGHEVEIKEYLLSESKDEDHLNFFIKWRDQPANEDLPTAPKLCNQQILELNTHVLGCELIVTMPNDSPFIELGESLLAALESALATGMIRNVVAREPKFIASITKSDFLDSLIEFTIDDTSGVPHLQIKSRNFDADNLNREQQVEIKDTIAKIVSHSMGHILAPNMKGLEQLFREDAAASRAFNFSGSFQVLGNILGKKRNRYLTDWIDKTDQRYDVKRLNAWDIDVPPEYKSADSSDSDYPADSNENTKDFRQRFQYASHAQVKTLSLIREPLWIKAEWQGVGLIAFPDSPPILAPIFNDADAAKCIFKFWEEELGSVDEKESLRISIIRHIDKNNPHNYRIVIGSNIDWNTLKNIKTLSSVSRIHEMTPESSRNLESFLEAFHAVGSYYISPAVIDSTGKYPKPISKQQIYKKQLNVREAWEIGPNDFDRAGIQPNDNPIIPDGVNNPPVNQLIKLKRANKQASAQAINRKDSPAKKLSSRVDERKKKKHKRQDKKRNRGKR